MEYVLGLLALAFLAALIAVVVLYNRRTQENERLQSRIDAHDLRSYRSGEQLQSSSDECTALSARCEQLDAEVQKLTGDLIRADRKLNDVVREHAQVQSSLRIDLQRSQDLVAAAEARYGELESKYGGIIEVDAEVEKRRLAVRDLDRKRRELKQVEEDLLLVEVGVYKPHFDWTDSARYKLALEEAYERNKAFIKANKATIQSKTWAIGGNEKEGRKLAKDIAKLVLRAFTGECDAAISKVRWNNFAVMEKRIHKAFETINKLVSRWHLSIASEYRDLWIKELILTHEHQELLQKEKDEQRRLREQIREEERAQREWEKARRDAEEQEARTAKALADVKAQLERARSEDAGKYAERIAQLEAELAEAHARGERAKSMAEQTKCGHVYIISNIGSFGEGIYKIGMTRREDPMERVKELGDASVPFLFDVHGLIYSDDAPNLESELHGIFADRRVNLVNERKEFFRVSMDDIVTQCKQMGLEVELTLLAEAKEYRQTEALRNERMASLKSANAIGAAVIEYVPAATEDDTLFEDKEEDD